MLPTIYGEKLPEIPEETLDKLLKTAEQNTILASVKKDGGFEVKTSWFESLTGVICEIDDYLVKWENKQPHKLPYIPDELDWPVDYRPGADVTVFTSERVKIKFSLSKTSFQYELCDYVKFLDTQGLKPTDVVTKFTTRQVDGVFGTYTVVVPELVDQSNVEEVVDLSAPQPVEEADPYPEADDDIPF
jgi:hypothetical protein